MRRTGLFALSGAVALAGAGLVAATPASARTFVSVGIGAPVVPAYGYGYGYAPAYYPAYYGGYGYPAPVVVGGGYYHRPYYRGWYGRPGWRGGYGYRGGYGWHGRGRW